MKIISWNCNMAFRNKYETIFDMKPDIIVLQECESKEKIESVIDPSLYNQFFWYGDNLHKGVAIINFTDYQINISDHHLPEFRYIIPLEIQTVPKINLYAVWAMDHKTDRKKGYIGQVWRAINYYDIPSSESSILIGDFNSHVRWDRERKVGNHSDVVAYLKERDITSLYHSRHQIGHGEEIDPTWYMYKHRDKPYHLDYCFVSTSLCGADSSIRVGAFDDWIQLSDHMPLILELDISP